MLVHVPVACWLLAPFSDGVALATGAGSFWTVSALLIAAGTGWGALAALAGAMDYARAHAIAPRLVNAHALLMGTAWTVAAIGLLGRVGANRQVLVPAPLWAVAAGLCTFVLMGVGAWCGGEMVYGRGIGVRESSD